LIGATGLVGDRCLRRLLDDPAYGRVSVFARGPAPREHTKLDWRRVAMDAPTPLQADAFICCLGTTIKKAGGREEFRRVDLELPLGWARAARDSGARHALLVSSVGAQIGSTNFYLATKGEIERAFSDLRFEALDIFRPSLLLGKRGETRWGERLAEPFAKTAAPLLVGSLRRYRPVEADAVAAALVAAGRLARPGRRVHEYDGIRRLSAL